MNAVRVKSSGAIPKNAGLSLRRTQSKAALPASPARPLAVRLFPWMTTLAAFAVVGNVVMYYRFSTLRPLVTVGSHTISKREYLAVLDEAAGKQVLNKMVYDSLIAQAAVQAGVTPTPEAVEARLAEWQHNHPAQVASTSLSAQRQTTATGLALENLRIQNIHVTDAEVAAYYAAHPSEFRQPGQLQASLIVTGTDTDARTAAHLLQQGIDPSIIAKQPSFHLVGANGFTIDLQSPSRKPIVRAIFALSTGAIHTFPLGGQYLTVKVFQTQASHTAPLSEVKEQVVREAKLQKAAPIPQVLAQLYQRSTPRFDIPKYEAFFTDSEQAARKLPATH
jgi:hypothetical protein